MVALLSLLTARNLSFQLEAHFEGIALYSSRLGIAAVLILFMGRRPHHPQLYAYLADAARPRPSAGPLSVASMSPASP